MDENNTIGKIHRYIFGEMTENESAEFEKEINENDLLKTQFEMEKKLMNALDLAGDVELKNTISAVHAELKKENFFESIDQKNTATIVPMKARRNNKMMYAIAATLVLLIAAWFVINNTNGSINSDAIYSNYYQTEKSITNDYINEIGQVGLGGEAETKEEKIAVALDQYNNEAFENANQLFANLNQEFPDDQLIVFYKGLCLMEMGDHIKSIEFFDKIKKDFKNFDAAQWYLGLNFLKNKEIKEAKKLFNLIAKNNNSKFQEEAKSILKEMAAK